MKDEAKKADTHTVTVGPTYDCDLIVRCSCGWVHYIDGSTMPLAELNALAERHIREATS